MNLEKFQIRLLQFSSAKRIDANKKSTVFFPLLAMTYIFFFLLGNYAEKQPKQVLFSFWCCVVLCCGHHCFDCCCGWYFVVIIVASTTKTENYYRTKMNETQSCSSRVHLQAILIDFFLFKLKQRLFCSSIDCVINSSHFAPFCLVASISGTIAYKTSSSFQWKSLGQTIFFLTIEYDNCVYWKFVAHINCNYWRVSVKGQTKIKKGKKTDSEFGCFKTFSSSFIDLCI